MDANAYQSGTVSEADEGPVSILDRRAEVRHTTLLQIAKIIGDYYEELCILRDISATGLRAESYWRVRQGEEIAIELKTGRRISGRVVWTEGKMIGVQFDQPVPVAALLQQKIYDDRGHVVRRPRLKTSFPALLRVQGREMAVHVCNVSCAGAGIRCDTVLEPDWPCEITLEALGRRRACVRWYRDGEAGVLLAQPLTYAEFGQWRLALAGIRAA